jgi:shikimate kinase
MRQSGKVVWLTARPDTILQRMSADASTNQRRPNLTHHEPLKEIVELLARRDPIYRETADYIIDTENRTPEALCAEILDSLKLK